MLSNEGILKGWVVFLEKNNLYLKYVIWYSIILLVPFLILIISGFGLISVMQNQILDVAVNNIEKANTQIEKTFVDMGKIAVSISRNSIFNSFRLTSNNYKGYECVESLKGYIQGNDDIDEIIYYIKGDDKVYTSLSITDYDLYFDKMYRFENTSSEEMYRLLNENEKIEIQPVEKLAKEIEEADIIKCIYPTNNLSGTIVFLLNNRFISNITSSLVGDYTENCIILDGSDKLISYHKYDSKFGEMTDFIKSIDEKGKYIVEDKANNRILLGVLSNNNWKYIVEISTEAITDQVNHIRNIIFLILILAFLIGNILLFFVTRINYKPLSRIVDKISKKGYDKKMNNISNISDFFDELIVNNEEINEKLSEYKPMLKDYILNELLYGDAKKIEGLIKDKYINASEPENISYVAVVIYTVNTNDEEHTIYINRFLEMLGKNTDISVYYSNKYIDGNHLLILTFSEDSVKNISSALEAVQNEANIETGIFSAIGIGGKYDEMHQIGQSFLEAIKIVREKYIVPNYGMISQNDKDLAGTLTDYSDIYEQIKKLNFKVKNGNIQDIKLVMNTIMNELITKEIPPFIKKCIIYDVFNSFLRVMIEKNIAKNMITNIDIKEVESEEELNNILNSLCENICEFLVSEDKDELLCKIKEYMNNNYTRNELSLIEMADYFDITPQYLSNYFKNKEGENIIDYITNLRIQKAKNLLENTDLTIKEIISQIGYLDASSFNRKFKKLTGYTPGEYRSNVSGHGEN